MSYEALVYDKYENVALVTLNRPEKLNALNPRLQDEVRAACQEARSDDDIRALVFTGAGRGFCSGVDLGDGGASASLPPLESDTHGQNAMLDELSWVGRQAQAVFGLDKPTIAAVNGIAVGAGMSLALSCDLRIGSENARFRTIFLERGISPDSGMSYLLPRIVGYSRAIDLILTSREVDAEEAYRLGLLDRLVPHGALIHEAIALANQVTHWPPLAVRAAKRVTQQNLQLGFDDALRNELRHLDFSRRAQNDMEEAGRAREEKRPGTYTGT